MVHQKFCLWQCPLFSFLLAVGGENTASNLAATASWETEDTGGGLQILMPQSYLLMGPVASTPRLAAVSKVFCL